MFNVVNYNTRMIKYFYSVVLVLFLFSCKEKKPAEINIGQKSFKYNDDERNRPLEVEVWYPTNDILALTRKEEIRTKEENSTFKILPTIPDAKIINGKLPLLIVSHGTGGNRFSLTWLIEKMVKQGYIVVSLGHYGNTTFNKVPREFVKWWERAIDVKFVLDNVLVEPALKKHIDIEKIGGIGFSLGGYTNIALAGGVVDRTNRESNDEDRENTQRELPPEFPKTDEVIDFQNDSLIVASYARYRDKVKDDRIKAFFVMAPGIGFGFHSKEQTKSINAPVFIIAGRGDTNAPVELNAIKYHELIPTSELHLLGKSVHHYVFLNEPTPFGKKAAPEITIDHQGVERKEIHDSVAKMAITFFNRNLKKISN